ncbi:dolichyl-phosphate beta-glucosyltransferase [Geranomyces variabilis]|uniref:dolichyl-phosphate beta-glucosyltransferase n=1 Tax=Geranomyces variabilis TaxID=109894 RepID=A0AAD5TK44_9FUNG|nr:dolichyl-phosphate beta-glucosyltransferase [Geranomyces variabilis]
MTSVSSGPPALTAATLAAAAAGFLAALVVGLVQVLRLVSPCPRTPTPNEQTYTDALSGKRLPFSSRLSDARADKPVSLSVIVPAYNETQRLPAMLSEALSYLDARHKKDSRFTYEVIVVDDGSKDATSDTAAKVARRHAEEDGERHSWAAREVRVLTLEKNRGKGGAVTQGMLVARGEKLLFADADGATRFSDVDLLERRIEEVAMDGSAVAVGSRAHMVSTEAVVKRSFIRNLLMHGFHTLLLILGISSIADTQCGFKMLTRSAAARIFPNMHVEGWIFDIELLLIALKIHIPVAEVAVNWHEVDGTKMDLVRDSLRMLRDLLIIRGNYWLGRWTVTDVKQNT